MEVVNALGRRKRAIARIFVSEGTGKITINKRDLAEYFPSTILQYVVKQPLSNFMAWMRERIQSRKMREGTHKGHLTTYKALQRFGKFKTFDDVTLVVNSWLILLYLKCCFLLHEV